MDIEGFEWGVLKNMVRWATVANSKSKSSSDSHDIKNNDNSNSEHIAHNNNGQLMKARDAQLPLQLFMEVHLDRDSTPENKYHYRLGGNQAIVGSRLRHFLDEMFVRGGYMVMFTRNTLQTRNTDVLLTKILCAK